MRVVFVGASEEAVQATEALTERGHEVVIVERERERIDELSDALSCGFIHGDGGKPGILKEAGPSETDVLLCTARKDETNIIAALVGRSLGFSRVVLKITDAAFENICVELGLQDTVLPSRMVGSHLADLVEGRDALELSRTIKGDARLFSFIAAKEERGRVGELGLPSDARVICRYRDDAFTLADESTELREGDEVVVLAHRDRLEELRDRWQGRRLGRAERSDRADEDA
jgi:trk system potassium uptake protein TrkA